MCLKRVWRAKYTQRMTLSILNELENISSLETYFDPMQMKSLMSLQTTIINSCARRLIINEQRSCNLPNMRFRRPDRALKTLTNPAWCVAQGFPHLVPWRVLSLFFFAVMKSNLLPVGGRKKKTGFSSRDCEAKRKERELNTAHQGQRHCRAMLPWECSLLLLLLPGGKRALVK